MGARADRVWDLNTRAMGPREEWDSHGHEMFDIAEKADARIAELEARLAEIAHAYDVTFKRRTELELALLPFAEFAEHVNENGWTSEIHREPISTWFGPSDFRAAGKVKA